MARVHYVSFLTDEFGSPADGATVTVLPRNAATPAALYQYATGTERLATPLTTLGGKVEFWADSPVAYNVTYTGTTFQDWTHFWDAVSAETIIGLATPSQMSWPVTLATPIVQGLARKVDLLATPIVSSLLRKVDLLATPTITSIFTRLNLLEHTDVSVSVMDFGAVGDYTTDDSNAIQAAIDFVDKYNGGDPSLPGSYGSPRGGIVLFPPGVYRVTKSIYTEARIRLIGVQGYSAGGITSSIVADPAGTYTNGPYSEKFLLKVGRRSTGGYWWHSGTVENMRLDCNFTTGLGGFHCWGSGENSWIDRVSVLNTGWTDRTVGDVVFIAGSKIITSGTAAFTQDDVGGRITTNDAIGFPITWVSKQINGSVRVKGSAVLTDDAANFVAADLGKQFCWTNSDASAGSPHYVVSVDSTKQVTMSDQFREPAFNTITITGSPTGGTFAITVGANTANPAFNASANTVRAALEALASVGTGKVSVTGSLPSTMKVTFLTDAHPGNVSVSGAGLTGGTSPTVTLTNGPFFLRQPQGLRIERVVNATTAWGTRVAVTGGSAASVTIRSPRPGVQYLQGGATMRIGSLNVSSNSGSGLEIINGTGGEIQSLTGDNNGTCLLRIRDTALGDHAMFTVGIKAENNSYGSSDLQVMSDHDPVILVDGGGMLSLHLTGTANSGQRGSRDMVRTDRSNVAIAGVPSFEIDSSGANPYNPEFENEFRDTDSSRLVRVRMLTDLSPTAVRLNPKILVNRDIISIGTVPTIFEDYFDYGDFFKNVRRGSLPVVSRAGTEVFRHDIEGWSDPNKTTAGTGWSGQYVAAGSGGIASLLGFNVPSSITDEAYWYCPVSQGTWKFIWVLQKDPAGAILDFHWSQDEITWNAISTSRDTYSAGVNQYDTSRVSNIAIPASGRTALRAKVTGRNASNSTGYLMLIVRLAWVRTA